MRVYIVLKWLGKGVLYDVVFCKMVCMMFNAYVCLYVHLVQRLYTGSNQLSIIKDDTVCR